MVFDFTKEQKNEKKELSIQKEQIAILSKNHKGWTIELNKISYDGRPAVYDLRNWSPNGKMGKGLTLTDQTMDNLLVVLKAYLEGELPIEEELHENETTLPKLPVDM